jgi:hypothetical protein
VAATAAALPQTKPALKSSIQPKTVVPSEDSTKAAGVTMPTTRVPPNVSVAFQVKRDAAARAHSVAASESVEAGLKPSAVPACVQPRIVTTGSVSNESPSSVVTPESPSTVSRPETIVKMEEVVLETTAPGALPSTMPVPAEQPSKVEVSAETGSTTPQLSATTENVSTKMEHQHDDDNEHDEAKCPDRCCAKSRVDDNVEKVKTNESVVSTEPLQTAAEEKSQSRSPGSSCSDEAKRKEDAVETISSC